MSNFPLYDTLSIDLPNIDITEKQKEDLLKLIKTIDTDCGISIIKKRRSEPYLPKKADYLTWDYYQNNKAEMMNIVPPPDMTYFNI